MCRGGEPLVLQARLRRLRRSRLRGLVGVRRSVLRHQALDDEQRHGDMLLPAGDREVQPRHVPHRRHPPRGPVLLRHLLGLRDGRHGHRREKPRRSHKDTLPPIPRQGRGHRQDRHVPPRARRHRAPRLLPGATPQVRRARRGAAGVPHGRPRVVPEAVLPLGPAGVRRRAGHDAVRHDR